MMKRQLGLAAVAAIVLGLPATHFVWGKAHVPAGMAQMCHKGKVIHVDLPAVPAHRGHGDCRINAAQLLPPLFPGDACDPAVLGGLCT